MNLNRRNLLVAGASIGLASLPTALLAQGSGPIKIGVLIPLTGGTSQFGATMGKAAQLAAEEINAVGGVRGRKIEVIIDDDQSNPEAAVRAARKLIDVDKVIAICGTYASSVTSAVAPLCWESKTMLMTASGADSITALPHQGYIVRSSPTSSLQGTRIAEFAVEHGAKNVVFLVPQAPFAQLYIDVITNVVGKAGGKVMGIIYEDKKASYRTEVDRALKANPDAILMGGYVPDSAVILKDLFRAGYDKPRIGLSFGINPKTLEAVPNEVSEGVYSLVPTASVNSQAYKRLVSKMKVEALDAYSCQVFDHINLVALALTRASGDATGTAIRDNVKQVSHDAQGKVVDSAVEGMKLLASGSRVNYDGASGPLEFAENGDVKGVFFRYEQIKAGKIIVTKTA
ncbi:MAG: ABC transporter substrate-binding protein [Propionivibrio sp.]|nr:ABC transporter substrate-binding protein [Propionivibrio sp.]